MAERETEEPSQDKASEVVEGGSATDEVNLSLKQKLLSKPMLIKMGIGLVIVLLAVAGYVFFASGDASVEDEVTVEEGMPEQSDSLDIDNDAGENTIEIEVDTDEVALTEPNQADVIDEVEEGEDSINIPEISMDIEEDKEEKKNTEVELSKIFKKATELQAENTRLKQQINELEALNNLEDKDPALKLRASEYIINRHTKEESDYPLRREIKRESPPEPKWGEFNTISK